MYSSYDVITMDSPETKKFFEMLDRLFKQTEQLTDVELSLRLKASRRTLQEWRDKGTLSFFKIGGKILYRESDIQKLLNRNYFKAYRDV